MTEITTNRYTHKFDSNLVRLPVLLDSPATHTHVEFGVLFLCNDCGVAVVDREQHDSWHEAVGKDVQS